MRRERNWMNPLPERLLCWMGIIHSPSLRRRPTLKEAITGRATMGMSQKEWEEYYDWLDKMFAEMEEEMKAVLVLDMPEACEDCDLCFECRDCMMRPEDIPYDIEKFVETFSDDRMPWCPLRPLPERKEEMDYLATGYNKCLDDILEGE